MQEKFSKYVFKPDTQLNLIEIITRKNAEKGRDDTENILAIGVDYEVTLVYFEHNNKILNIEKQAQEFMSKVSEEQ